MSKMFQVYGIGQALIPMLPPPLPFKNPPTIYQKNYEIGQVVYYPPVNPSTFYLYSGSGKWTPAASRFQGSYIVGTGSGTLVAGTVTISDTRVLAGDVIQITRSALNASPALGSLIYTISSGVSIAVTSYSAAGAAATTDVSGFTYSIVRAF